MILCERNVDCLECLTRGMCNSYAMFKYNQAIDDCIKILTTICDCDEEFVCHNCMTKRMEQLKEQKNDRQS